MLKRQGVLKEFGPEGIKVVEEVASSPSFLGYKTGGSDNSGVFCMRIDADEFSLDSFKGYYPFFESFTRAFTVFFNAFSFKDASSHILRCRDMGVDVQSHAYYHYTYDDYESNRYNIKKAKDFFLKIGVSTTGFAAPMGRWNPALMRALEDEGYLYSSDFSYDYLGFPSFPGIEARTSKVMEIPVFPVAPELFFEKGNPKIEEVAGYYKNAIDKMIEIGMPVIVYGHTNPSMPQIPELLKQIAEYAIGQKALQPVSMTDLYKRFASIAPVGGSQDSTRKPNYDLDEVFTGRELDPGSAYKLKDMMKNVIDFEKVTPDKELMCTQPRKMLKLLARKIL